MSFTATTPYCLLLSSYAFTFTTVVSIITHLRRPLSCIYTAALNFTTYLPHCHRPDIFFHTVPLLCPWKYTRGWRLCCRKPLHLLKISRAQIYFLWSGYTCSSMLVLCCFLHSNWLVAIFSLHYYPLHYNLLTLLGSSHSTLSYLVFLLALTALQLCPIVTLR